MRAAGKSRRRMQRQLPPTGVKLAYFAALRPLLKEMHARTLEALRAFFPARADSRESDQINHVLKQVARAISRDTFNTDKLQALVEKYFDRTSLQQKQQLIKQIASVAGFDPFIRDQKLLQLAEQWTKENVALIQTVPKRYFPQVEQVTLQAFREGTRWEELATDLTERFGVAEFNAQRIARDQVGKLAGDLNKERQTELGIDRFVWRTVHDNRVRSSHEELDGKTFSWDAPPLGVDGEEIIPGQEINCRCFSEPSIDHLLPE